MCAKHAPYLAWSRLVLLVVVMASATIATQPQSGSCNNSDAAAAAAAVDPGQSPAALAQSYDKMIAAQQIGAHYSFWPEQHYVVEAAQRLLEVGFTSYKFRLRPEYQDGSRADLTSNPMTLLDVLTDSYADYPYLRVLDLPFSTYQIEINPHGNERKLSDVEATWYQEVNDLAAFLIERYEGTGKTFYLGGGKGDFQIRSWSGIDTSSAHPAPDAAVPIDPYREALFAQMWWQQQAAIDDAKADMESHMKGVQLYSYIEVNLMKNDTISHTVIDDVILSEDPAPDYISVALTDMPQYASSTEQLVKLLDYVAEQLLEKPGVPGPRVLLGEVMFPLADESGHPSSLTPSQDLQAIYSLNVAAAAIAWGSPLSVVGSLYDHTVTTANTAPRALGTAANITVSKSQYQGRGLGLVDISGNDTVLYKALKEYMSSAEEWLEQQITAAGGSLPCRDTFRQWAVNKLTQLAKSIMTTSQASTSRRQMNQSAAPALMNKQGCAAVQSCEWAQANTAPVS